MRYTTAEIYEMADDGDPQAMAVCRAVARCSGRGRYALRQWKPQSKESRAARQALSVDRLRLRAELLRRLH
ncbi:MAG: hypothetical protein ABSC64_20250 [Candidatus Korobacteraceae bacterium]